MEAEIKALSNLKSLLKEGQYKSLIAKVALHYLEDKGEAKSRHELYKKVNEVLKEQQLGSVSYGFIRKYEKKTRVAWDEI